ncbi:type IV pilin [Haloplanus halobius]|uniref:type IV pilin n=1 Tax=Haloplanus halobius TaxID=2934938 RepID=UPI0020109877
MTSSIGVILLVALAVLLATVAGAYVLSSIDELEQDEPRAMFSLNAEGTTVEISHTGGDAIDGTQLYVTSASRGSLGNYAGTDGQSCQRTLPEVDLGTDCHVPNAANETLYVIWRGSGRGTVLARWPGTGPVTPTATATPAPPAMPATSTATPTATGAPTETATPTATPTPSNQPPVAAFTASRRGRSSNVDLDASAASDPDGTIVSYEWYVGSDGAVDYTGDAVSEANVPSGTAVTLVVTDDDSATASETKTVT